MSGSSSIILHVEDDPNDVLLLKTAVKMAGIRYGIRSVRDGLEAINYLSGVEPYHDRAEFPMPLLVLLDLKMPRTNGFDVLRWIRSQSHFKQLPVVIFTSSNHAADMAKAYEYGANSYLLKPVTLEDLVETLKAVAFYWGVLNQTSAPA